jgi:hypothetical protein
MGLVTVTAKRDNGVRRAEIKAERSWCSIHQRGRPWN